ncbi:MAG TPA: DUF2783 domain-containing protein [Trinickia sp.]|jgi:hypothetical protein|nr:DUF2783 domain-containing protein [Trinickia sp.]
MLNTNANLTHPDDFYEALIDMHRELRDEQSLAANAQLILLLANHIGDQATLMQAMRMARGGVLEMATQERAAAAA